MLLCLMQRSHHLLNQIAKKGAWNVMFYPKVIHLRNKNKLQNPPLSDLFNSNNDIT